MPTLATDAPCIDQLLDFAERHFRTNPNFQPPVCRRTEERLPLIAAATVQPVTGKLILLGPPFQVATRDISISGIGFVFDGPPEFDFYTINLTVDDEKLALLGMTVWHSPMGPFELVGMDVVRRLDV